MNSPRRALRKRTKPKKYGEFMELSPTKRRVEIDSDSSEDEEFNKEESIQKPSALFNEDDVKGEEMFQFKTRHTKLNLQNKVISAISCSPKVDSPMKTPRKSFHRGSFASPMGKANENTPKHVRNILKKRIMKEVESDSDDGDFSDGSSDDFVPERADEDSDDGSDSISGSGSEDQEEEELIKKPAVRKMQFVKNKDGRQEKDSEYIVTPDNYFMMNASKKIVTSDHTLSRLKNMNLNENIDIEDHISQHHKDKIAELNQSHTQHFDRWIYNLSRNYSIILYGVGSKRTILQQFQEEKLKDFPCIVVNGFFPSLTIRSILETIIVDLLECSNVPSNVGDVVSLVDGELRKRNMDLFLIVHNIDGGALRGARAQGALAGLAAIEKVHLIATIDHINAPLLWDHTKLSKFKFTWFDVTTFLPYSVETSYETSLLATRSATLQLSSLRSVYQSLTTNAKGIFKIIIKYQLEHHKQPHYQGLPFKELYSLSREQFLASSDVAVRAQLTEFTDHQLVKVRRAADGAELLLVPIQHQLLQEFLEQQEQEQ